MGVHRWLLGPVVCLILAVASARPPECEEPPSWSIGRRQPLAEAKGKQASSLESLQKHFRTYGMNDLEFIIVNSMLPHAQAVLHELESRVSFPVYQDTAEKNIWKLMEGGKDDIYVYDRCGRLAYYIPYPLSIMNSDEALVVAAILATYYRSPCGATCDKNSTISLEDILNAREMTDTEISSTTEMYPETSTFNTDFSNMSYPLEDTNNTLSNETLIYENKESPESDNDIIKFEDFDYSFFNDTGEDYETNKTNSGVKDESDNSLYNLFFNNDTVSNLSENSNTTLSLNTSSNEFPKNSSVDDITPTLDHHRHHKSNHTDADMKSEIVTKPPKRKSDRCIEAGISVCRNWSKRRLIRAHTCCSSSNLNEAQRDSEICRNFGKKRCKKLRTILKCCIKTAFIETATTQANHGPEVELTTENSTVNYEIAEITTETSTVTEVKYNVVCCKNVEEGRLCRVALTQTCDEDEFISENANVSEVTDSDSTG